MKIQTVMTSGRMYDEGVEIASKIASRMGWMPERNSSSLIMNVPDEDMEMFEFIFEFFM